MSRRYRMALSIRLTEPQNAAAEDRATRAGVSMSEAVRELLDLGLVLDAAEGSGLAITGQARTLLGDAVGVAHVQFGLGLEPAELAAIADDLSAEEREAVEAGAPVLVTVEQMAAMRAA